MISLPQTFSHILCNTKQPSWKISRSRSVVSFFIFSSHSTSLSASRMVSRSKLCVLSENLYFETKSHQVKNLCLYMALLRFVVSQRNNICKQMFGLSMGENRQSARVNRQSVRGNRQPVQSVKNSVAKQRKQHSFSRIFLE